jgi:phosphoglycolate phosphatase
MPNALFDLDGTLCDPREGIAHGFRHALDALGLPYPGDAAVTPLIGLPLQDCFTRLGLLDPAQSAEASRHFQAFFEGRGFAEARLYPGVEALLAALRRAGWGLAIASAKPTFAVRFVAEGLGIIHHFDSVHGCAPEDLAPDKAPIVGAALSERGWAAADTLMIGDRRPDRDAAAAHGLRFVGAAWGFGGPGELEGAVAVARSPADLAAILARLGALR